ncbi:MAG: uroporphyrinogen decarboxylase [Leptospira sp.]|nr:uroporphyrinogen decarboxylase [Leptospira sp.]
MIHSFRNQKFQNAIERVPQKVPPIWFMRQAGRYHSHYRKLKETYTFMQLCKEPELAAEVALGPVKEFGFDVSILFSDLLFPLEALGMGLEYNPGPKLSFNVDSKVTLKNLRPVEEAITFLEFQRSALIRTREVLPTDVSLIGFVGGPYTLMTYACIGKHDGNSHFIKNNPDFVTSFYEILIPLLEKNIQLQLDGGAEIVMIFDTSAGCLDTNLFSQYVVSPIKNLANRFPKKLGYYTKNSTWDQMKGIASIESIAGFGFDHRFSLPSILKNNHSPGFIQGNFDQELLFADESILRKKIKEYLEPIVQLTPEERLGWVSGLGHGVLQFTPERSIHILIEEIRNGFSK